MRRSELFRTLRQVAILLLVAFSLSPRAFAASITLTPVADTDIRQDNPYWHFPDSTDMVSGRLGEQADNVIRRALLRFDLSNQIPSGITITSVTLKVSVVNVPRTPANSDFGLHRVLKPWTEAGVTWLCPINSNSLWQVSGAIGATDSVSAPSGTVFVEDIGIYTFASTTGLITDVQSWLDHPESNCGWLLRSETEEPYTARHFTTHEDTYNSPILTISFPSPQAPTINYVRTETNTFTLAFNAEPGFAYVVESRNSLSTGQWTALTNIPPQSIAGTVVVQQPLNPSQAYFRVRWP